MLLLPQPSFFFSHDKDASWERSKSGTAEAHARNLSIVCSWHHEPVTIFPDERGGDGKTPKLKKTSKPSAGLICVAGDTCCLISMFRIICAEYLKSNSNMRNHIASRNHYNSKDMINRICNHSDDHRSFFLWRSAESFGETRSRERCKSSILDACRDAQVLKCIPRCTSADAHHVQQPNLCTTVHRAHHALTLPRDGRAGLKTLPTLDQKCRWCAANMLSTVKRSPSMWKSHMKKCRKLAHGKNLRFFHFIQNMKIKPCQSRLKGGLFPCSV